MKILHALVGYLAVTALPFLAFASPLATIDYDGYVNTTQSHIDGALLEQALDTIAKTCQTITTQNLKDSGALTKRVPDDIDIIEPRQVPVAVPVTGLILFLIADVVFAVVWISFDEPKREKFTVGSINKVMTHYNKYNWVICHSSYSLGFDGVEGTDWGYTHHELGISFGRTIGYDLFWARSGTFYRQGDGGFINWAYNGKILSTENGGATVHFGQI